METVKDETNGKPHFGRPELGGSPGTCAICGRDFAADIIVSLYTEDTTGSPAIGIGCFEAPGVDQIMYYHKGGPCDMALRAVKTVHDYKWLPHGPLRDVLEDADARGVLGKGSPELEVDVDPEPDHS